MKTRRWAEGGRESMVVSVEERGFNGAVRAILRSDDITGWSIITTGSGRINNRIASTLTSILQITQVPRPLLTSLPGS